MTKNQAEKATPAGLAKEYSISLAMKDGQKMIRLGCEKRTFTAISKNGVGDIIKARKQEIIEYLETLEAEQKQAETERQAKKDAAITEFDANITDDTIVKIWYGYTYREFHYGVSAENSPGSKKLDELESRLNKCEAAKIGHGDLFQNYHDYTEYGDYSDTVHWKLTYAELLAIIEKMDALLADKNAAIAARHAKKEAEIAEKFAEAKKTGEPVLLRQWDEPCNDKHEECSMDNMYEYAMPDGSRKTKRVHTY